MTIIRVTSGELGSFGLPHADSIVFYVDASNPNSYVGSGTDVVDITGNGTAGTIDGGATVSGGAFQTDGAGTKGVSFTKNSTLDNVFLGGATIITFLQANDTGIFVATENAGQTLGWKVYGVAAFSNDGIQPRFIRRSSGGTDGSWNSSGALPTGAAFFQDTGGGFSYGSVAVTYDETLLANDPTFYTNGIFVGTPTGTNPSALGSDVGEDLVIANRNGGGDPVDGQTQVTIIWSRILTAEEVLQVHNTFITRMGRRGGVPGVMTLQPNGGAAGASHLIRASGLEQTHIADGNSGCTNLGLQSVSGKGISGSGIDRAAILSGYNNEITSGDVSAILSGTDNTVNTGSAVICGGSSNVVSGSNSGIVTGSSNSIQPTSGTVDHAFIGGGFQNVCTKGVYSGICSGRSNEMGYSSSISTTDAAFIGAGRDNNLHRGHYSSILGGQENGIGPTTDASYAWVEGGYQSVVDGADFGNAAGRQAKCNHPGATIWADDLVQDEHTDRDKQHKRVYSGGFTERTTAGFGGAAGDPGEAVERFNGHATTTSATPDVQTIGTLDTDQQTMMFEVSVHSVQDAGANARFEKFMVTAYRTGGTVTAAGTQIAVNDVGATGVTYTFGATGDNIEITITGVAAENWQHSFFFTRQKGGLTS